MNVVVLLGLQISLYGLKMLQEKLLNQVGGMRSLSCKNTYLLLFIY